LRPDEKSKSSEKPRKIPKVEKTSNSSEGAVGGLDKDYKIPKVSGPPKTNNSPKLNLQPIPDPILNVPLTVPDEGEFTN